MKKMLVAIVNNPLFRLVDRYAALLLVALLLMVGSSVMASGPDPTTIYAAVGTDFDAGVTIAIGAWAILVTLKWIKRSVR